MNWLRREGYVPYRLAIGFFVLLSYSQQINAEEKSVKEEPFIVRKVRWGMSRKQVWLSEDWKLVHQESNILIYKGSVGGYECRLNYHFVAGNLKKVKYSFSYVTIDFYRRTVTQLIAKYGHPKTKFHIGFLWTVKDETFIGIAHEPEYRKPSPMIVSYEKIDESKVNEDVLFDEFAF